MKRKKYQKGGLPNKKNKSIRDRLVSGLDKAHEGFYNAMNTNMDRLNWEQDKDGNWYTTSGIIPTIANVFGSMPAVAGAASTGLASNILQKLNLPNIKSNPDWKEDMKKNAAKFKPKGALKKGGKRKYQKGGKRKTVTTGYIGNPEEVASKKTVKRKKKKTIVRESSDTYAGKSSDSHTYGDKKLWRRRYKSKVDDSGTETKRKEKIVYDDGNQMTKRKQKKIRFGKNKGKIKSKTVNYNRGKRTVTKRLLNKTDKTKLQKGGFLEAPITRLFED
tara:strand:+ start:1156 stop:1980 length:825 start_codon:yes stop_codon:yes gene_type:complete